MNNSKTIGFGVSGRNGRLIFVIASVEFKLKNIYPHKKKNKEKNHAYGHVIKV